MFEVPTEIAAASDLQQLLPFIEKEQEFTRMAAVRRLAQIEGPQAVSTLLDIFWKESPCVRNEGAPLVKLEVIRLLSQTNTERSKEAVLSILVRYWQQGPNVKEKKGYRLDRDFACVMDASLRSVATWGGDSRVFERLETIALSSDVGEFYAHPHGLGQTAWEAYLKSKMKRQGITAEKASLGYLLDFMRGVSRPVAYGTFDHVKYEAAFALLQEHSESALSALVAELTEESAQGEAKAPEGIGRERTDDLLFRIGTLKGALSEKARRNTRGGKAASSLDKS